jgi:hypothetical protein
MINNNKTEHVKTLIILAAVTEIMVYKINYKDLCRTVDNIKKFGKQGTQRFNHSSVY